MPFNRPTLATLQTQAEADLAGRLGLGSLLRRSVLRALARMVAGLAHLLNGHLVWISRQYFPDTADDAELTRIAGLYGIARKVATHAAGTLEFSGSEGSVIPLGTLLRRVDGVEFATLADGVIVSGSAEIEADAVVAGDAGNTSAGAGALTLSPALAGILLEVEVLAPGLTGGTDAETDAELRDRVVARLRSGARGGSADDYVRWALEVPGVSRAWALPLHMGPGTVGVTFFVSSGLSAPIPDVDQIAAVDAYIDERRPVTATPTVFAPGVQTVDVEVAIVPDTAATRAAVTAALVDFFDRVSDPSGVTLYRTDIEETISTAPGTTTHTLTTPAANVPVTAGSVAVLGTLDFL